MSLFLLEGGNCYASEQQLLRGTIETPSDNYTVRGRVIDVYGEPLIGATITSANMIKTRNDVCIDKTSLKYMDFKTILSNLDAMMQADFT